MFQPTIIIKEEKKNFMESLSPTFTAVANTFKIEFINFYAGISHGEFFTCYPHARLLYSLKNKKAMLDDGQNQIEFKRGMWLLIPPMVKVKHSHIESNHLAIHFNTTWGMMELLTRFDSIQYAQCNELMPIAESISSVIDDPVKFVNAAELMTRYVLHQILQTINIDTQCTAENMLRYQDFIQYLQKKSDARLKVADMARFMGMGEQTFARKFAADWHITPHKFNEKILSNLAVKLLEQTELSLKEIAEKLHFANEYHFSRFFKRNMRISPGKFRRELLDYQQN